MRVAFMLGAGVCLLCLGMAYGQDFSTSADSLRALLPEGEATVDTAKATGGGIAHLLGGKYGLLTILIAACAAVAVVFARSAARSNATAGGLGRQGDPLLPPALAMIGILAFIPLCVALPAIRHLILVLVTDPTFLCQTILAIMAAGIFAVVFQFFSLRREASLLSSTMAAIQEIPAGDPERAVKIGKAMERKAGKVLYRKWLSLKDSASNEDADFDMLVSFADQAEMLKESKVIFVIKLLPLMGLMGTVIGFVSAVGGMQQAAANMADFATFKGNLMDALAGMATAFNTTLSGVGGMIPVLLLNSLLIESRRRILLRQNEFLYVRIFLPFRSDKH